MVCMAMDKDGGSACRISADVYAKIGDQKPMLRGPCRSIASA
jgi:hypothetical protein